MLYYVACVCGAAFAACIMLVVGGGFISDMMAVVFLGFVAAIVQ
jgi:hypothetical protein